MFITLVATLAFALAASRLLRTSAGAPPVLADAGQGG